jgi:hypothetical protein
MAPIAPQGAVKIAPAITPEVEGIPVSAGNLAENGERITPTVPTSVPGASRMTY